MRIAIDANELCKPLTNGVKVYTYNVLKQLLAIDHENEYLLYSQDKFTDANFEESISKKHNFVHKVVPWNKPFWTYLKLPYQLRKDMPDVLFMPIQTVPFLDKSISGLDSGLMGKILGPSFSFAFRPQKMKIVTTVHDLAFLKFPEYFTSWDRAVLKINTRRAVKFSDTIITPSETTRNDIAKYYFHTDISNVRVVPSGYDNDTFYWRKITLSDHQVLTERYKINKKYILFVGVLQPRKNVSLLVKSFKDIVSKYGQDVELILAGGNGWMSEKIFDDINNSGYSKRIKVLGEVSLRDLAVLMRGAEVFVLPSLYEGFGLPILEAMASGAPVVTSNVSSMPEVGGDAAVYFDPANRNSLTAAILKILTDGDRRETLRQKGFLRAREFSWKNTAEGIRKVLLE